MFVFSRNCLVGLLFVTNLYLQKALMYIHYICDCCTNENASKIVLFEVNGKVTYDLEEFLDMQDHQCLKASQQILLLQKNIAKTILCACQVSYVHALIIIVITSLWMTFQV